MTQELTVEEKQYKALAKERKAGARECLTMATRALMEMPMHEGPITDLGPNPSMDTILRAGNTTYLVQFIKGLAMSAIDPDCKDRIKAAELLIRLGAFEPPKEQQVTFTPITFVDDMTQIGEGNGE